MTAGTDSARSSRTATVVFRVDASVSLGLGHVMRCLTLAEAFVQAGWRVGVSCRPGTCEVVPPETALKEHDWWTLRCDIQKEPEAMATHWPGGCDVLVVDQYYRGIEFETACRPWARRIVAIDDFATREHDCDYLLDQTLGRAPSDYHGQVPAACRLLTGTSYALLRPQFYVARKQVLLDIKTGRIHRIFVGVGATDPHNITGRVLEGIAESRLNSAVDVVLGARAPHLEAVRASLSDLSFPVTVHVEPNNVASLMARADLAVGAAGVSALERCCVGLPTLLIVAADNQQDVAAALERAGAAHLLGKQADLEAGKLARALQELACNPAHVLAMSSAAHGLCDGLGVQRVMSALAYA